MDSQRRSNVLDPIAGELPPRVWDHPAAPEPTLKPVHAHWITSHIYEILDRNGYDNPQRWLRLYVTGSLCGYQYSDSSDADVSLFVDSTYFPEWSRAEMIGIMIKGTEGLVLPGTPYELQAYVVSKTLTPSDLYQPGLRAGYDISNHHWVAPPDRVLAHDVESQDNGAYVYALEVADKMHKLLEYEPQKAVMFWHQIHKKRSRDEMMGKGDTAESNLAYKMLFKKGLIPQIAEVSGEHIAKTAATIPPKPGTTPIPEGHIRLYHYTGADPEQIRQQGILLNQARGEQYGEPNQVWASARQPSLDNHNVVEFAVHRDDPRWDIGKYEPYINYGGGVGNPNLDYGQYLHDRGADVTFRDSIRPKEILAVHEPWHQHYRYLQQNYPEPSNEFDWALQPDTGGGPDLARAVQEWKSGGEHIAGRAIIVDDGQEEESKFSPAAQGFDQGAHRQALAQGSEGHDEAEVEPYFPTVEDAIEANKASLEGWGQGNHALLRPDALAGALARPQQYWHYTRSLPQAAAALAHGVSQSQAFEDGNKRTAYWLTHHFLHTNGLGHVAPSDDEELADHLIGYGEGTHGLDDTANMFAQRLGSEHIAAHRVPGIGAIETMDAIKALFDPYDPQDAIATHLDLDTVTPEMIQQAQDYVRSASQQELAPRAENGALTVYRAGPLRGGPTSFSLVPSQHHVNWNGPAQAYQLPVEHVLGYSGALSGADPYPGETEVIANHDKVTPLGREHIAGVLPQVVFHPEITDHLYEGPQGDSLGVEGYEQRWPSVWDNENNVVHIGPEGSTHWQLRKHIPDRYKRYEGWIGHNPEAHMSQGNSTWPDGREYGWYEGFQTVPGGMNEPDHEPDHRSGNIIPPPEVTYAMMTHHLPESMHFDAQGFGHAQRLGNEHFAMSLGPDHPEYDPYYDEMAKDWRQLPYLYHQAPAANRENILREGLRVMQPNLPHAEPGVYVEGNPEMSQDYWGHGLKDQWRIDQRYVRNLLPDYSGQAAYIPHDIPPEAITLHKSPLYSAWTAPGDVSLTTQPSQVPMQQGPFSPYANVNQWQVNVGRPSLSYANPSEAIRNMMFENHPETPFQIMEGEGGWEGKPEKSMALHIYDTPHHQMQDVMHTVGRHFPEEEMFGIIPHGYESTLWTNPYHKSKRGGVTFGGTAGFGQSWGSEVIEPRFGSQPISVRSDLPDGRFSPSPVALSDVVPFSPLREQKQPVAFGSTTHREAV